MTIQVYPVIHTLRNFESQSESNDNKIKIKNKQTKKPSYGQVHKLRLLYNPEPKILPGTQIGTDEYLLNG